MANQLISNSSRAYRWLIWCWVRLRYGKVRLLPAAYWDEEGPTLFVVGHAPSMSEALTLATAFPRPIHFLLPKTLVPSALAERLARGVGMIPYEGERPSAGPAGRAAAEVLVGRGRLAVFAEPAATRGAALEALASAATSLVQKAESAPAGRRVTVHPVHLFLPVPPSKSREGIIYVDSALVRTATRKSQDKPGSEWQDLISTLEARLRQNAFQLRPPDMENFLKDIEELLRSSLQEEWSSYQNWRQNTEGFVLSRHAMKWAAEANSLHPAVLASLHESLDEYRALLQRIALHQGEMEAAGSWAGSPLRRALVWLEFILGVPVSFFGLLNHLAIGLLLFLAGSFKKDSPRKRTTEWTIRGAVILGCYVVQTLLVAHRWGRAAAGYYAPALPITGAYLARFWWLLRHRVRLLYLSVRHPAITRMARQRRQSFLDQLDQVLSIPEEKTALGTLDPGTSRPA